MFGVQLRLCYGHINSHGKKVSALISVGSRVRVKCSRGEDTGHVPIINVPDAASQPHLTWLSFLRRCQVKEPPRFLAPCPRPARVLTGIICPVLAGVLVMCTDGASCHPLMISAGTYTLMDLAASLKQITLMFNTIFSALSVVHPYTITV